MYARMLTRLLLPIMVAASPVLAEVRVAPKQLVILKPGMDKVHGTWIAAVINDGNKPQRLRLPILIPRETLDFQPMEGIVAADVKLENDGPYVEKDFGPGVNVVSFAFVATARQGFKDLSFGARADVGEFTVMTPKGMLSVRGQDMVDGGTDIQDLQMYNILVSKRSISKGDELRIDVSGVPEGRQRLWLLGAIFATALVGAAGFLTWRFRKESQPAASSGI